MPGSGPHRRGGYYHHRRRAPERPDVAYPLCPVCQRPVRELASAIAHRETGGPAHFDCILKILREENQPAENEKICYLGNGSFGVVQFRGPMRFFVRKRVQYEKNDPPPEWRKSLPRQVR
jgi:hypothetical protein